MSKSDLETSTAYYLSERYCELRDLMEAERQLMESQMNKREGQNKYDRAIIGEHPETGLPIASIVDVYCVLDAFKVTDPALQHLVKKALCSGLRGHKDTEQDLIDIVSSAKKALALFANKKAVNHGND